jgi:hypothetical protein
VSRARRRFARVYYDELERDYPQLYYSADLGWSWLRLLVLCEKAWPSLPELPRWLRIKDYRRLVELGALIPEAQHRFTIKGWVKEREDRATKAREAVASRNDRTTGEPTNEGTNVHTLGGTSRTGAQSSSSSSSSVNGGGAGGTDPADAYWSLTGRYPVGKSLEWIDDLIAKFGAEAVTRHLVAAYSEDPKTSTILGRTQNRLRAEARALDRQEAEDEKARLREKRAIPKELPAWEAEYRAAIEARYAP